MTCGSSTLGRMVVLKSRRILIRDDTGESRELIWCDATCCETCLVRFQCLTTENTDLLTYSSTLENLETSLEKLLNNKWRLRDGSSEYRNKRVQRIV